MTRSVPGSGAEPGPLSVAVVASGGKDYSTCRVFNSVCLEASNLTIFHKKLLHPVAATDFHI